MKKETKIAAAAVMFLMLLTPYAISAERNIVGELTILPYAVSADRNITQELSTTRYTVSKEEKVRKELAVITSFALIDYDQSVAMFYGMGGYHEINPIMGPKPSRSDMITFGVIGIGLFYVLADILSDPWRQVVVDSIIASERLNIEDNRRLYQGWNTDGPPQRGRLINSIPIVISLRF